MLKDIIIYVAIFTMLAIISIACVRAIPKEDKPCKAHIAQECRRICLIKFKFASNPKGFLDCLDRCDKLDRDVDSVRKQKPYKGYKQHPKGQDN